MPDRPGVWAGAGIHDAWGVGGEVARVYPGRGAGAPRVGGGRRRQRLSDAHASPASRRDPGTPLTSGGGDAPGQACSEPGPGAGTLGAEEGAAAVGRPGGARGSARAGRRLPAAPARVEGRLGPSPVPAAGLAGPRPSTPTQELTCLAPQPPPPGASAAAPGLVRAAQTRSREETLRTPANRAPRPEAGRERHGLPPISSAPPEAPRSMRRGPIQGPGLSEAEAGSPRRRSGRGSEAPRRTAGGALRRGGRRAEAGARPRGRGAATVARLPSPVPAPRSWGPRWRPAPCLPVHFCPLSGRRRKRPSAPLYGRGDRLAGGKAGASTRLSAPSRALRPSL